MSEPAKPTLLQRFGMSFSFSKAFFASVATGIALLLLTGFVWMAYNMDPQRVAWDDYVRWPSLLLLVVLWVSICSCIYWIVRLWREEYPAVEAELQKAWKAGMKSLTQIGCSIEDKPIFLILGCHDFETQKRLVAQSNSNLVMEPAPNALAPINWFLCDDRIYLFCSDTGTFGTFQQRMALYNQPPESVGISRFMRSYALSPSLNRKSLIEEPGKFASVSISSTASQAEILPFCNVRASGKPESLSANSNRNGSQTPINEFGRATTQTTTLPRQVGLSRGSYEMEYGAIEHDTIHQIEQAQQLLDEATVSESITDKYADTPMVEERHSPVVIISSTETVQLQSSLSELGRLLRVARCPVAPINGIIAVTDGNQLSKSPELAVALGHSLQQDLKILRDGLQVDTPLSIAIGNMQLTPGFTELIRRIGPLAAANQTLGETFSIDRIASASDLRAVSRHAISSIVMAVYYQFHLKQKSGQPGNQKLFQLLVACRSQIARALTPFLLASLISRSTKRSNVDRSHLFAGLYFSANGEQAVENGFTSTIFQRMFDQQELINWTNTQKQFEQTCNSAVFLLKCVCSILTIALLIQWIMWGI